MEVGITYRPSALRMACRGDNCACQMLLQHLHLRSEASDVVHVRQ